MKNSLFPYYVSFIATNEFIQNPVKSLDVQWHILLQYCFYLSLATNPMAS
jgi:hypothetical protein